MNLDKFLFPIEKRTIYLSDPLSDKPKRTNRYKGIVRSDSGKLISIMRDTYQVIPNSEVINPLLDELSRFDTRWYLDPSHSFVEDSRMRLQITFPELTFNDGRSDISLSLYLHNSYNGSEGVRMLWGGLRQICSNGMVMLTLLSKFYGKHTQGLDISNLKHQLHVTYEKIPQISSRISQLQNSRVNELLLQNIRQKLGVAISKYIETQKSPPNQWILFNYITYFVSHNIEQRMRSSYQIEASKLFKL